MRIEVGSGKVAAAGPARAVLSEKDRFEYQGYVATLREAQQLLSRAESVGTWAEGILTSMRRS